MDKSLKFNVRVGHVCLEVSNVVEAKKFYEPVLRNIGFEIILEDEGAVGLSNGLFSMWLGKPSSRRVQKKMPSKDDFVIADHVALLVPDRKIVDQVAEVMERAGFKPLFPPEEHAEFQPGYYSVSFCDPDNNVVEFYTIENREK